MSVSDRAAALAAYIETLLEDREVQAAIRRAASASRETYERARGKSPAEAVRDKRLRYRAQQAVAATWDVWAAVSAPETHRPPRWGRRLVLVTLVATGAYVASNPEARTAALGLIGGRGPQSAGSPQ
jgi:hypothetical protein